MLNKKKEISESIKTNKKDVIEVYKIIETERRIND